MLKRTKLLALAGDRTHDAIVRILTLDTETQH
jgi:hypothetical protein